MFAVVPTDVCITCVHVHVWTHVGEMFLILVIRNILEKFHFIIKLRHNHSTSPTRKMPWGKKKSIDDFITRLAADDPLLTSLCVLTSTRSVDSTACVRLSAALRNNTVLTELLLSGHAVGEAGAAAMSDMLAGSTGNHTLQTLCIGSQQFSDVGARALASHLGDWNSLRTLDLELKNIGPDGASALGTQMATNTSLRTLTLSRNPLTDAGIVTLLTNTYDGAENTRCALNELRLVETGCSVDSIRMLSRVCTIANKMSTLLTTLKLDRNVEIGATASSGALSTLLAQGSCLQDVSLSGCALSDVGILQLSQGMSTNTSLHQLNISNNGIGVDGMRAMSSAFTCGGAPQLHTLVLSTNVIGEEGANFLAESLSGRSLTTLNLQSCKIGAAGAASVGVHVSSVVELNMMDCCLGDEGVLALVANITKDTHGKLRSLNLCANDMTDVSGVFVCDQVGLLFTLEDCNIMDELTGRPQIQFILGLGANKLLGAATTAAVERLLDGRRGFQVARDKGADNGGDDDGGEDTTSSATAAEEEQFSNMLSSIGASAAASGSEEATK